MVQTITINVNFSDTLFNTLEVHKALAKRLGREDNDPETEVQFIRQFYRKLIKSQAREAYIESQGGTAEDTAKTDYDNADT